MKPIETPNIHCAKEAPAGTRISAQVLVNGAYWQRVIEDVSHGEGTDRATIETYQCV
jgi:hypothetical protein